MKVLEEIRRFLNEKVFKKGKEEILMLPQSIEVVNDGKIDLDSIITYINRDRYSRDLYVHFIEIKSSIRKKLLQKVESELGGKLGITYDEFPILEGMISHEYFISVKQKQDSNNRIGQAIITDKSYVKLSTRTRNKNDNYRDVQYQEFIKNIDGDELYKFDAENGVYYRRIRKGGVIFTESAGYGNSEAITNIEQLAQPRENNTVIMEYNKITKLPFIFNDGVNSLANALKGNPYVVNIEARSENKKEALIHRMAITKIFKSKKECIVGYRPEVILLEGLVGEKNPKIYRLLPEGVYVDNNSFKKNFEGRYTYKKVDLEEIENIVNDMPFSLSQETKQILRNGIEIPNYIKMIYNAGVDK